MSRRRDNRIKRVIDNLMLEIVDDVPTSGSELHIFDFDETLAYTPEGEWKLFFGHYIKGFKNTNHEDARLAIDVAIKAGVKPKEIVDTKYTSYMLLNHAGYEQARNILNKAWRDEHLADLPQREQKYGSKVYMKPMSLFFHFPEESQKEAHQYQALPCLEIMRSKLSANIPCYVCTARSGIENIENILDFLNFQQVKLPAKNIFAVGSANKGLTVNKLIDLHQPEKTWFYDDSSKNCDNVYKTSCKSNTELHIIKLSRATPGEIQKETVCGNNLSESYMVNHTVNRRNLFRRWRKLGGI